MKSAVVFLLAAGLCSRALAQGTVSGYTSDLDGNPLAWVNVRVLSEPDSSLVAYAFSDESGHYSIRVGRPGAYLLRFDAMAFRAQDLPLQLPESAVPVVRELNVALPPSPLELKEVVVRAEPAVAVGRDTVEIRVAAFATGSERVAEDLLKRLPGIEVGSDGGIRVRGRAVSKVLIEGDDLFDRGYPLLTKNLSAEVIDRVQILKGYTDNPVLRGLDNSDAVALNIRLKEEVRGTLFGKGFLGGSPGVYETDLNLIRVRRQHKAYFLGNLNNSGRDAMGDLNALLHPKVLPEAPQSGDELPLPSFLPQQTQQTGLSEMRSRSNDAELASLSGLFGPLEGLKVKGHYFYSGDEQGHRRSGREFFRTDSLSFENTETERARRVSVLQSGRLTVLYTTRRQRLEWLFGAQTSQLRMRRHLLFNRQPVSEDSRENAWQAHSRLSYSRRLDSSTAFQLALRYQFDRKPLRMRLGGIDWGTLTPPGTSGEPLWHHLSNRRELAGFEASVIRGRGKLRGRVAAGYLFRQSALASGFDPQGQGGGLLAGPAYRNRGLNRFSRLHGGVRFEFVGGAWSFQGGFTAQYLTNRFAEGRVEEDKTLALVPSLTLKWQPGRSHFVWGNYAYGFRETPLQEHYAGYLPGGFRLLQRGLGSFQKFRSHRWLLNYTFGDWGDPFLMNTSLLYTRNPDYPGSDSQVRPELAFHSAVRLAGQDHLSWSSSYDQYVRGLKSNFKLRTEVQVQRYESSINGVSQQNSLLHLQVGPELRTVFDGGFNAHGGLKWMLTRFRGSGLSRNRSQSGFLDLEFRCGAWLVELSNEGYRYRDAGTGRAVWFTDLGMRYSPNPGGAALRVQLSNTWNTASLSKRSLSETGRFENRYALRPRQLLVGLDFRF